MKKENSRQIKEKPNLPWHVSDSLDVVIEELLEKLLGVVAAILSPGASTTPLDIATAPTLLLSFLASSLLASLLSTCFRILGVRANVLIRISFAKELVEQVLGPHYAVHRFARSVSNGAARESLLVWLRLTLVAFSFAFPDNGDLPKVASSARLDQGDVGSQAHPVDVVPGLPVVQGIEAKPEALEEVDAILRLHNIILVRLDVSAWGKPQGSLSSAVRLCLTDVLFLEEELPVQVGDIDGVQVDDLDVLEAAEHDVLQQLASDSSRAHHQDSRVLDSLLQTQVKNTPCQDICIF